MPTRNVPDFGGTSAPVLGHLKLRDGWSVVFGPMGFSMQATLLI
jgi:hypothetical protein